MAHEGLNFAVVFECRDERGVVENGLISVGFGLECESVAKDSGFAAVSCDGGGVGGTGVGPGKNCFGIVPGIALSEADSER